MMVISIFYALISILLIIAINIIPAINIHKKMNREKMSPFECGFDPFSKPRIAFSIHFFYISLMFLIFDIEITLVLPTPIMFKEMKIVSWLYSSFMLFSILLLSLLMEWKEGSMNWL